MKDAYSFDVDQAGLDKSFEDQRAAYIKIFTRCGLKFSIVEASPARWAARLRASLWSRPTRARI
jgi:hypothetical protein